MYSRSNLLMGLQSSTYQELNWTEEDWRHFLILCSFRQTLTHQILQVHSVHHPGSWWDYSHVFKCRVDPLEKLESLVVPLHLRCPVRWTSARSVDGRDLRKNNTSHWHVLRIHPVVDVSNIFWRKSRLP